MIFLWRKPPTTAAFFQDAEALIKEARQRQKKRRVMLAGASVALVGTLLGLVVSGGGAGRGAIETPGGPNVPATNSSPNQLLANTGRPFATGEFEQIAGIDLWAVSAGRIYRSNNAGSRWFDITPPNFLPNSGLAGFAALNSNDLWFGVNSETSNPTVLVDRSINGGRSWQSGGCKDVPARTVHFPFLS